MTIYAKKISSKVRKVLGVAKVYMSPGSLQGAVVSLAFMAGISVVSTLQAGDWDRDFVAVISLKSILQAGD